MQLFYNTYCMCFFFLLLFLDLSSDTHVEYDSLLPPATFSMLLLISSASTISLDFTLIDSSPSKICLPGSSRAALFLAFIRTLFSSCSNFFFSLFFLGGGVGCESPSGSDTGPELLSSVAEGTAAASADLLPSVARGTAATSASLLN